MFSKILIANRGEIAVRIIRACKEMGISTVAVYSEADREALHVSLADESVCIGPAQAKDSYLNMTAILSAAIVTGAEAIHPGYGLLSENPKFAALCQECNLVFIGPDASILRLMGDKDQARKTMRDAGVPVIPGGDVMETLEEALAAADAIGYPLLIKARSGGGGRGIRRVNSHDEFTAAYKTASAEAESAFGDGAVYLEKFLYPAKHVEVQILADKEGNVICLGERECSIQRKNQKLLEESPSPALAEGNAAAYAGNGCAGCQGRALRKCRNIRIFSNRTGRLLLYGDEHPSAGRAYCNRDGNRHRSGKVANPHCRWYSPVYHPGGSPGRGLCHRVPYQRRGQRAEFSALCRPDYHAAYSRWAMGAV